METTRLIGLLPGVRPSTRRDNDRVERHARRLARHHKCPAPVDLDYSYGTGVCGLRATKGQLCDTHFEAAFSSGLVLH